MTYMYACPACRRVFKSKYQGKKIKCPECSHEYLLELMIDDEAWGTLTCDERRVLVRARMSDEGLAGVEFPPVKKEESAGPGEGPSGKTVKRVVKKRVVKKVVKKPPVVPEAAGETVENTEAKPEARNEEKPEEKTKVKANSSTRDEQDVPESPQGDSWETVLAAEEKKEEKEKEEQEAKKERAVKKKKVTGKDAAAKPSDDSEDKKEEEKKEAEQVKTKPAVDYRPPKKYVTIVAATLSVIFVYLFTATFVIPTFRIKKELPVLRSAAAGDTVQYGRYKGQDEWVVLDRKGSKLLCISNYPILGKTYDEENWDDSGLRKWFNSIYINSAFNVFERMRIRSTKDIEDEYPDYSRGINTDEPDKIFIITDDEILDYLKTYKEAAMEVNDGQIRAVCWIETE